MFENGFYELKARDVFFRPLVLTAREIQATLLNAHLLLFLALVVITLTLADLGRLLPVMPIWRAVLVWVVAVFIQAITYAGLALAWARAQDKLNAPVIYLPILGAGAYVITYVTTILHISLQTDWPLAEIGAPGIALSGYVVALVFEALYFAFVLPNLLREIRPEAAGPARHVHVAGETIPLEQIETLRSERHFVRIVTADRDMRLRARLSDLVSQTEERDGILAHRSHWVARHAIHGLEQTHNGDLIITRRGERLKVAATRQDQVRAWLARHAPEIALPPGQSTTTPVPQVSAQESHQPEPSSRRR